MKGDMEASFDVALIIESLISGKMPSGAASQGGDVEPESFDRDDPDDCKKALGILLDASTGANLFHVVSGMSLVLDPTNGLLDPGASTLDRHSTTIGALAKPEVPAWRPESCPVTGRQFFMWIDHPSLGRVPTYGGPFDSYTIPTVERDGELRAERYDHDLGGWIEGGATARLSEKVVAAAAGQHEVR